MSKKLLENLSENDIQDILALLKAKYGEDNVEEIKSVNPKRKQRRKSEKSPEQVDEIPEEPKLNRPTKSGAHKVSSRKDKRGKRKQVRTSPRGGKSKGTMARTEPVAIGTNRENRFLTDPARFAEKADAKIDKLLAGANYQPKPRKEAPNLIEVDCNRCGDTWAVPPSQVYRDDEGVRFVCEVCTRKRE